MVYRQGFYIPSYTVLDSPEFATWNGFIDPKNRKKLASMFLRPTTWLEYCNEIKSKEICESGNDTIAFGYPLNEEQENSYFVNKFFYGYFRNTAESECGNETDACYGHYVGSKCAPRRLHDERLIYFHNIPMITRGKEEFNNGYDWKARAEIWGAALHNRAHVMMVIGTPNSKVRQAKKTDKTAFRVQFPVPTEECIRYVKSNSFQCSDDLQNRLGGNYLTARCDFPQERTMKIVSSLVKKVYDSVPITKKSPALDFINSFSVELNTIQHIIDKASIMPTRVDGDAGFGYAEREEVCRWVYDNIEKIEQLIPRGYPRNFVIESAMTLSSMSLLFSVASTLLIFCISTVTYKMRHTRIIRLAQFTFLTWMLGGNESCDTVYYKIFSCLFSNLTHKNLFYSGQMLISIGALVSTVVTSSGSCIVSEWFILAGYTLALSPIFIKVAAINKISHNAERLQRTMIDGRKLKIYPLYVLAPVIIFLTLWTAIDRPLPTEALSMQDNDTFGTNIKVSTYCASNSKTWIFVAYSWQALILVSATVLTFQSRNVQQDMNESRILSFMIYSQSMFYILRVATVLLTNNDESHSLQAPLLSLAFSVDVITSSLIYMTPKLLHSCITSKDSNSTLNMATITTSAMSHEVRRARYESVRKIKNTFPGMESSVCDDCTHQSISNFKKLRQTGASAIKQKEEVVREE